jgi:hypothetical protein
MADQQHTNMQDSSTQPSTAANQRPNQRPEAGLHVVVHADTSSLHILATSQKTAAATMK